MTEIIPSLALVPTELQPLTNAVKADTLFRDLWTGRRVAGPIGSRLVQGLDRMVHDPIAVPVIVIARESDFEEKGLSFRSVDPESRVNPQIAIGRASSPAVMQLLTLASELDDETNAPIYSRVHELSFIEGNTAGVYGSPRNVAGFNTEQRTINDTSIVYRRNVEAILLLAGLNGLSRGNNFFAINAYHPLRLGYLADRTPVEYPHSFVVTNS